MKANFWGQSYCQLLYGQASTNKQVPGPEEGLITGLLTKMQAGLGETNKDVSALYLFLSLGLMGKGMEQFPEYRQKGCIDMTYRRNLILL